MTDTPFVDRKFLIAHVAHELVSSGWNRGETDEPDEAVGLVREGEKKRRGRKPVPIETKVKLLEECEAAIEKGEFTSVARFVEAMDCKGRMSKSNSRQWLKDAEEHRKSSEQLE